MDLKALMQKLEAINTTQIVAESVETKQIITESVAAPVSQSAEPVFKSSIARSLAEEFGYKLDERIGIDLQTGATTGNVAPAPKPDPNATAATAANTKAMQDARAAKDGSTNYTSGLNTPPAANPMANKTRMPASATPAAAPAAGGVANPYQGADAAKFAAMSPADQAWLTKGGGKPDINDQFILARAPNKGAAVAAPAAPNAAAIAGVTPKPQIPAADATAPGSFDSFGTPVATGSPAATSADPTGLAQAQQDVNAAGSTPAAATTEWPADKNAIIAFQKANGLTADGMIGPKTMAALQKSGATPPAGFKPVGAKAAAPKAAPATPAAAAPAGQKAGLDSSGRANASADPRIAGNAQQVAAAPKPAYNAARDSQAANTATPAAPTVAYNAAKDSQAANTAAPATAPATAPSSNTRLAGKNQPKAPVGNVAMGAPNADKQDFEESVQTSDDQILAIIRDIRVS
jgi:trimeric autotransporter adhesin